MLPGHPPLLDTNDRAQAHDPEWKAAQVAARDVAEEEAAVEDEERRGRHEAPDPDPAPDGEADG